MTISIALLISGAAAAWFISTSSDNQSDVVNTPPVTTETTKPPADEFMALTVYLQDTEAAMISDCGVTLPTTIRVPRTRAVADASLTYLFTTELARYGNYESVVINNTVAEVTIANDTDPTGLYLASLSSCEARHLISVLSDTLTQYDTIDSIELFSPTGKIEF